MQDEIVEELKIEKIKTIGDAYMVVAGIPERREDHAVVMLRFAVRMLQALDEFNEVNRKNNEPIFGLRVGIHCGTVIAGVVGSKKYLYDVWGATANLASRMESTGIDRRIQIR